MDENNCVCKWKRLCKGIVWYVFASDDNYFFQSVYILTHCIQGEFSKTPFEALRKDANADMGQERRLISALRATEPRKSSRAESWESRVESREKWTRCGMGDAGCGVPIADLSTLESARQSPNHTTPDTLYALTDFLTRASKRARF